MGMAAPMRESGKVHNWLPFKSEDEARHALFTYAIHANLPDAALIWTDATGAKLLQQGKADKDGDVQVPIAHAHGPIPPPVVPPRRPACWTALRTRLPNCSTAQPRTPKPPARIYWPLEGQQANS
jgi:hypothetical protein